jgi:hypothetical protein
MQDLNASRFGIGSGWNSVEFWMNSVNFWSNQLAAYGDDEGFYARSIQSAWEMVEMDLFA